MSGESDDYTPDDLEDLLLWMDEAFGTPGGNGLKITAKIEWSGTFNRQPVRTVNIQGLNLDPIRAATAAAVAARVVTPRPAPKTWSGQLNWLQRTKAGREALRQAGFNPAAGTLRRWKAGTQKPSAANRARLEQATAQRREEIAAQRVGRYEKLRQEAADRLTEEIGQVAGGDARFREITQFEVD